MEKYGKPPPAGSSSTEIVLSRFFLSKPRVQGTLVYPNALAGIVLLLFPASSCIVWQATRNLRRVTTVAAVGLTTFLGLAGLFWSGSKSGWLIALAVGVFWLCSLNWPPQLKRTM